MGISTYQSYCGAQIFDAVGLKADFVNKYFTGTATRIEGVGLDRDRRGGGAAAIATRSATRRSSAACSTSAANTPCACAARTTSGTPPRSRPCSTRCAATRRSKYRAFAKILNEQDTLVTIRGLFRVKTAEEDERKPVPIDEVEPAKNIVKRFATGAMSFGSISREAHTTLAIAMNRIGGKSNTGEGGEEADRFKPLPNGDSMRSAIKQVASGRFGVTAEYLVNSDMMQIKMAQGAKPGEGGQLPGHKVDKTIAKVRHSTPGVGLISPPPHHDIYSIEDLAQLIFDLKNVNPDRRRVGEARLRSRRRHRRRRRVQGARRPCDDLGLRGRHRRVAPSPRSSMPARRGRSASPKPTRRWSPTGCAAASPCRSTAASAPAATW